MAAYAEEVLDSMLAPATARALPATAAHVLAMMRAAPPAGAAAALRGRAERPDYREGLARIDVPALVVVGSEDVFAPVAEAELLHRGIPSARLAVVEGAGHLPNLERPEAFNQAVAALLAEVTATGRPHAPADVPTGAPAPVPADARAHGALPPDGSPQRPDSPSGERRKAPQI
ncbi:alpha/beta fold hydrolase [Actinacidiphila guanduensis]|uniref:Alpha/beta hydrolase family protein n=1 Tax=Actinacidiphila guanduensis TaxID=310781 RepID=A0A1H0I1G9_9ACTN|nr:alpha/beta hydrolase [Actinacidiphila guanduensis]SDO25224.1 Alpha/beta hydrolase family protein [Actinacidiphila guanduensis]